MREPLNDSIIAALKRRAFLRRMGVGVGAAALQSLMLGDDSKALAHGTAASRGGRNDLPHHPPRVKNVIFLCMAGGPSHLETFDYKPQLNALDGQAIPESFTKGQPFASRQWSADFLPSQYHVCCHLPDLLVKALLIDLKQRGLLDETLIIWGGEFGRTPMIQYKGGVGRDHHIKGFSMWMAGGGVKSGTSYGNTDELGYHATENPVHVRDLHATMLHLLGIDHQRFSVPYQGLDMRLIGVDLARVLHEVLST